MFYWIIFTLVISILSVFMHRRQNKQKVLGGEISKSKAFWLFYTIYTWFFTLPFVVLNFDFPRGVEIVWIGFSISMWLRGIAELWMLFVSKNWTPPIGVTHDIICFLWLIVGTFFYWDDLVLAGSWPLWIFHVSLIVSIVMETIYAYCFFKLVGPKTKGADGIWFAPEKNPLFQKINRLTFAFNIPLYLSLGLFLVHLF